MCKNYFNTTLLFLKVIAFALLVSFARTANSSSLNLGGLTEQSSSKAVLSKLPLSQEDLSRTVESFVQIYETSDSESVATAHQLSFGLTNIESHPLPKIRGKSKLPQSQATFLCRETGFSILWDKTPVGRVVLRETPENNNLDGDFSLHLIELEDAFQGQGLGGKSLDCVIMLSQVLATTSSFYSKLTLQCSDYDADGTPLGNVPHRLAYYLNRGFQIDPRTLHYMRLLDMGTFVHQLKPDFLKSIMLDYSGGSYSEASHDFRGILKQASEFSEELFLDAVLSHLKMRYVPSVSVEESVRQIAESSSSTAGQVIIDRMFYDSSISTRAYNKSCGEYIYILSLDVLNWEQSKQLRKEERSRRGDAVQSLDDAETENFLENLAAIMTVALDQITSQADAQEAQENVEIVNAPSPLKRKASVDDSVSSPASSSKSAATHCRADTKPLGLLHMELRPLKRSRLLVKISE